VRSSTVRDIKTIKDAKEKVRKLLIPLMHMVLGNPFSDWEAASDGILCHEALAYI